MQDRYKEAVATPTGHSSLNNGVATPTLPICIASDARKNVATKMIPTQCGQGRPQAASTFTMNMKATARGSCRRVNAGGIVQRVAGVKVQH